MPHPQLFLITPEKLDPTPFKKVLRSALSSGEVASLLITKGNVETSRTHIESVEIIESIAATAHEFGVSVLIENDCEIVKKTTADGIHINNGIESLKNAIENFQPSRIVGAGGISTRHQAMKFAEANADYVFFGNLNSQEFHKSDQDIKTLAEWWADIFEIPGVALAGPKLDSIGEIGQTGIEFVAVREAIWNYQEGVEMAIRLATKLLKKCRLRS